MACRAFAAAFLELERARGVAATCVREADRDSDINALDAENQRGQRFNCRQVSRLTCKRFQEVSQR
jgi:hypothetical protein